VSCISSLKKGATTPTTTTFSITTLSAKGLEMAQRVSDSDTQHNNALPCTEYHYAECHVLFTIMLSDVMLNVVVVSVVVPNPGTVPLNILQK
jgi:hypothetical protein